MLATRGIGLSGASEEAAYAPLSDSSDAGSEIRGYGRHRALGVVGAGNHRCCISPRAGVALSLLCVVAWAVVLYAGILDGVSFLNKTRWGLHAPDGSQSKAALDHFTDWFPHQSVAYPYDVGVVITPKAPSETTGPEDAAKFNVKTDAKFLELTRAVLNSTIGNCTHYPDEPCYWRAGTARGWWVREDGSSASDNTSDLSAAQRALGGRYVSADGMSTVILLGSYDDLPQHVWYQKWDELSESVSATLHALGLADDVDVDLTQEEMLLRDARTNTISDFEHSDMVTLPIAWVLLALTVGPPAVCVLITLPMSALGAFLVLGQLANTLDFASFTPSIYASMLVALNLDFSLFILTRYREEVMRGASNAAAVAAAMRSTGRVVFVSGVILGVSFAGLSLIDMALVANIGIGGSVVVGAVVLCNLTLMPALLALAGPLCCRRAVRSPWCQCQPANLLGRLLAVCCDSGGGAKGDRSLRGAQRSVQRSDMSRSQPRLNVGSEHRSTSSRDPIGVQLREVAGEGGIRRGESSRLGIGRGGEGVRSCWLRVAGFTERHRLAIVGLMLVLTGAPFMIFTLRAKLSIDQMQLVPRDAPSRRALEVMQNEGLFAGDLAQIAVILQSTPDNGGPPLACVDDDASLAFEFVKRDAALAKSVPSALRTCGTLRALFSNGTDSCAFTGSDSDAFEELAKNFCQGTCTNYCPTRNHSIVSDAFFETVRQVRSAALTAASLTSQPASVRDVATIVPSGGGPPVALSAAQALAYIMPGHNQTAYDSTEGAMYRRQFADLVNFDRTATRLMVAANGGPFGSVASSATSNLRDMANRSGFAKGCDVGVVTEMSEFIDAVDHVYAQMPRMVSVVILVVVFVCAAAAFKSILIAARLLLTILVTSVWLAGTGVLIFQDIDGYDGFYWIAPVCTAPLVVGLTIDYDLFVVSRVYEYRYAGFTTRAAISRGLVKTGGIVTTAGVIMCAAFSALLLSGETVLNQFGYVLVSAAVIDTFIVRTFFVPALLHTGVEWNWWPGKPPPATRDDVVGDDTDEEDSAVSLVGNAALRDGPW